MVAMYCVALFAAGFSALAAVVLFRAVDHFDAAGK
jgi:hypothetical protein